VGKQPGVTSRPRLDWLALTVIGLTAQVFWIAISKEPSYMDAYYYAVAGQRLAGGHGFTVPVIWQFLDNPAGLPAASHTYWMPFPSILAAAGYRLVGGYLGARLPFWLLGGSLPLLTVAISQQLGSKRWQTWAAGLFTAAGGFYASFLGQTTTFAPFAWAAGGSLLATTLAIGARHAGRARFFWLITGLAVGLAHLTRADGALLLIVVVICGIWPPYRVPKPQSDQPGADSSELHAPNPKRKSKFKDLLFLFPGYLLLMVPWFARNTYLFGRPLLGGGIQGIFLTSYDDIFAYGRRITVADFMEWGFGNILRSRLEGLWVGFQNMFAVTGLIFLGPFVIIALWHLWKRPSARAVLRPALLFTLAIFLNSSLLFTFPGMRGTLFHASVALWPWAMALAPIGIGLAVAWAARRLPHWQPDKAGPTFSFMFVGLALVLSLYIGVQRIPIVEQSERLVEIGQSLPENAVVMTGDAPAFFYHTGIPALNVPNEPPEILLQAADRYGATYLLLDQNHPSPLASLYTEREQHPRLKMVNKIGDIKVYEIAPNS